MRGESEVPLTIFSVGFRFPGGMCEEIPIRSDRSLLDADVILFQPRLTGDYGYSELFNGEPDLYEYSSFQFRADMRHWRSELHNAFDAGKTTIIYLSRLKTVYVHTDRHEWSGTGRNARKTNIVEPMQTYSAIPLDLSDVVMASGENIRPAKDLGALSEYWSLCADHSHYEVYLGDKTPNPLLMTRSGNKIVGAAVRGKKGNTFLLPVVEMFTPEFVHEAEEDEEEEELRWTSAATRFGKQLLACLAELHGALAAEREESPPPTWTMESGYRIDEESTLEQRIEKIDCDVNSLRETRRNLTSEKERIAALRGLLFEKGKPLERVVLESLQLMGFQAKAYRDSESEFDAVFMSPEGRFLGEVEGKDNSPINIDKLSQLERNIQEDFKKETVIEHAHGVLFGNAFRLLPLEQRKEFFTPKCLSGARRSGVALVRTPDLFGVARYIRATHNDNLASMCRRAILDAKGEIVKFPEIPAENAAAAQVGETT